LLGGGGRERGRGGGTEGSLQVVHQLDDVRVFVSHVLGGEGRREGGREGGREGEVKRGVREEEKSVK